MQEILAVDDEQDILFTLEAISEVADFKIVTVNNGEEALKKFKQKDFSLIMVDYHMPGMSGLKLVKKIREIDKEIPILVLTVDESIELANNFLKAGATDFANKPIKTADLISRINLHINKAPKESNIIEEIKEIDIPKGMSFSTLGIITNYLEKINEFQTIDEISEGTGLAYQTVHRYLKFLNKKDFIKKDLTYGNVGRPIHKYKIR